MKKIVSVMLVVALLCLTAVPAFAVSNCKASYNNGKVSYSCDGVVQIEVYLDGALLASKAGDSIDGSKTTNLAPGTHSVTFSDLDSTKTVTFEVAAPTVEPTEEPPVVDEPTKAPVVDDDDEDEVPKTGDASTTMTFVIGGMMLIAAAWLCVVRVAANRK